jgi:hypothetical protein
MSLLVRSRRGRGRCPKSFYSKPLAVQCEACQAGQFSEFGAAACTECTVGHQCRPAMYRSVCPIGSVALAGMAFCTACAPRFYTNTTCPGHTEEDPVAFCDEGGAGICLTCDPGYRCSGGGNKVLCRAGQYAEAGRERCTDCAPGRFSHDGSDACVPCTPGYEVRARPPARPGAAPRPSPRPAPRGCSGGGGAARGAAGAVVHAGRVHDAVAQR